MKKKNNFQLQEFKYILNNYTYIYFFRYNDLTINEIKQFKQNFQNISIKFFKKNQIQQFFPFLKYQNSIFIIYTNNLNNNLETIKNTKKIFFLFLINTKKIFSNYKLKNILLKKNQQIFVLYEIFKIYYSLFFLLKTISRRI